MNEEEMKAARAKFLATLKAGNALVNAMRSTVAWTHEMKDGIDALVAKLADVPVDVRDAAVAALTDDKSDGVVASFTYSDATVDSYGDTISPDGWKLDDYKRNPVVLFAHDQGSPPIGQDIGIHIVPGKALKGIVRFTPSDLYPFGDMIGRMVRGGFLRATSVGFAPIKYTINEERSGMWGMPGIDYIEQVLRENTVCPVPANPNALADTKALKAAGIDVAPLVEWATKALDGGGRLVVPRATLEAIAKSNRTTVVMRDDGTADLAPVEQPSEPAPTETKADEGKCPGCGHEAPLSAFHKPAPAPIDDDTKAALVLPTKALLAALAQRGELPAAPAVDSTSQPRKDEAAEMAATVAKLTVAEVNRQLMERTGRLP